MFRPFIWESNNLLYLISSLESSFFTYLVLRLFLKINHFFTIMRLIFTKPIVIYCVFFSLFFFLFVGISSTNFGSLIRYKIPSTPFLLIAIFIIEFEIRQKIKATKNK